MALVRNHPDYSKFRMKIGFMMDFSGTKWSDQEIPKGVQNGVNSVFTIEFEPRPNTEEVFKDGMKMARGVDYTIDHLARSIKFMDDYTEEIMVDGLLTTVNKKGQIPQVDSVIRVNYQYSSEN